jgi:recombination protein RecA
VSAINKDALAVAARVNKKYGAGTIVLGSEIKVAPTRISSGSLALDVKLGGGWPEGWSSIVGEESHGKTLIALQTIRANQEADPDFTVLWVAAEEWMPDYAEMNGVDINRIILVRTNIMEEAYGAVLDYLESKTIDLVVIDSLPVLTPRREEENDVGETTPGRAAYLTNQFFRLSLHAMARSLIEQERPCRGIAITQWRSKIGVSHGDPRTTPNGQGQNYSYNVRLDVRRTEWIEIGPSGNKKRIGQVVRGLTIKNKTAPPQQVGFFDYYFDEGGVVPKGSIDFAKECLLIGIEMGVIERGGAWYYYPDKETGRKWNGKEDLLAAIYAEPDLKDDIIRDVLDVVRVTRAA